MVQNKTGYTVLAEDEKPPLVLDYIVYPVLLCTAVHFGTKYKTALTVEAETRLQYYETVGYRQSDSKATRPTPPSPNYLQS